MLGLAAGSDNFTWEYLVGTNLKSKPTYPNAATAEWTYEAERDLIAKVKNNDMKAFVYVFGVFTLLLLYSLHIANHNEEENAWRNMYISQLIPFEKLEQISVNATGFLQSQTCSIVARISENENLDEILDVLRNAEFDEIKETEEHLFCSTNHPFNPHYPLFVVLSKETRVVYVRWFHL